MTINFTETKLKQLPNGNQGMSVALAENDNSIVNPVDQKQVSINTANLTQEETATVNAFIALCKSKIPV